MIIIDRGTCRRPSSASRTPLIPASWDTPASIQGKRPWSRRQQTPIMPGSKGAECWQGQQGSWRRDCHQSVQEGKKVAQLPLSCFSLFSSFRSHLAGLYKVLSTQVSLIVAATRQHLHPYYYYYYYYDSKLTICTFLPTTTTTSSSLPFFLLRSITDTQHS